MKLRKQLRDRWSGNMIEEALSDLGSGELSSPFGHTDDGLVDYRGLKIQGVFQEISISNVDFSYCKTELAGQFIYTKVTNVLFAHSELKTNLDGFFKSCNFESNELYKLFFLRLYLVSNNLVRSSLLSFVLLDLVVSRRSFF